MNKEEIPTLDNYIRGVLYEKIAIVNKERDKQLIEEMIKWAKENSTVLKQYQYTFIDEEIVEHILELGIREYLKEIDPFLNIEIDEENLPF